MTNQMIPGAAVEAAAWVLYVEDHLWGEPWETANVALKEKYRTRAIVALEAAAPYMEPTIKPRNFYIIQAVALREAFHEFPLETITAPDNAAVWMKTRADDLDRKAERA